MLTAPSRGRARLNPAQALDAPVAGSSENDRDIEAAKKPYADYDAIKDQLRTATDSLKALEGVDVKDLQGQIAKLTKDLSDKESEHQAKLAEMEFDGALKDAITAARGRSIKAIRAELDVDTLRASKNQTADAYKFGYRNVGIADVYQNKLAGIYLHHKA